MMMMVGGKECCCVDDGLGGKGTFCLGLELRERILLFRKGGVWKRKKKFLGRSYIAVGIDNKTRTGQVNI